MKKNQNLHLFFYRKGFSMDFRTDLALERRELLRNSPPKGVESLQYSADGVDFTKIKIISQEGAENLGKPVGTYITAELTPLAVSSPVDERIIDVIAGEIRSLLPKEGTVLAAGLGNSDITPDAVGPKSVSIILATRHLKSELINSLGLGELRSVAVLTPGVLGRTGIETAESIKGMAESVRPSAVIVIDALAARKLSRLGNTVQISDTGISPGSGVGNARSEITEKALGVPVISVGIPTVADAQTLVEDLTNGERSAENEENSKMIVTPREIDIVVERASKLIGLAVNKALQPHLSIDEIMMLAGN